MESLIKDLGELLEVDGVGIFVSLIAVYVYRKWKLFYEFRKQRRTQTLQNIKDYYDNNDDNTLIKEMLFQDHFGKVVSLNEISFFERNKFPNRDLQAFLSCHQYLKVSDDSRSITVIGSKNLKRIYWLNLILYFIFGTVAILMAFNIPNAFSIVGPEIYAPWSIVTISLLVLAGIFMDVSVTAMNADKLYKSIH